MSREIKRWGCLTYERCQEIMGRRNQDRLKEILIPHRMTKKLGPNTYLDLWPNWYNDYAGRRIKNVYVVRFYSTPILVYSTPILAYLPDGRVTLNTGGHREATTKQRLNALGPVYVTQERCRLDKTKVEWWVGEEKFFDGFTVGDDSLEYQLFKASKTGELVDQMAYSDYLKEMVN